ncbi:MAG: GntR family transcriptional regulator [Reichenbachiella sp.]|uniref:GntR family transcriptional regulator n=1 Tax=Reichenbachiella sp. TaxID=2184521 RepID=UPI0029662B2B|nr:GntR family transcriptional regulator [Reichenbachiella sp.]MDW3211985.1 GntR family transcriptional regulator [Reichenbachiella sp.]
MKHDFIQLDICDNSNTPKYKQIIDSIIWSIKAGKLKSGDKLPSINQLSFDYYLSRDTVEKAYRYLCSQKIIQSIKRRGYYILDDNTSEEMKILLLVNDFNSEKKTIYNEMIQKLSSQATVDYCDYSLFKKIIKQNLDGYQYYVIMPGFENKQQEELNELLREINSEKLILLDTKADQLANCKGGMYQDFKEDIYNALVEASALLRKYEKLILIFPEDKANTYPADILAGFKRFCGFNQFKYEIYNNAACIDPKQYKKSAFVVLEEEDLVTIIKNIQISKMKLAKDTGILSYNDSALKEVLAEGISVMTTDFVKMGQVAAGMILGQVSGLVKNDFHFMSRASL